MRTNGLATYTRGRVSASCVDVVNVFAATKPASEIAKVLRVQRSFEALVR